MQQLVKQRRDSVEQFRAGGRPELADKEQEEITFLEKYLPPAADAGAIAAAVDAAVLQVGATSIKDMGKVMKAVNAALAGRTVDGPGRSGQIQTHSLIRALNTLLAILATTGQTFPWGPPSNPVERHESVSHPSSGQGPQLQGLRPLLFGPSTHPGSAAPHV